MFGLKAARSEVRATPDQLKIRRMWQGLYIIQVKFPPGVVSRPHFHPEDRYATEIKGTWYTGAGDEFAPDTTISLKLFGGSF